jgi:hypothetical protein
MIDKGEIVKITSQLKLLLPFWIRRYYNNGSTIILLPLFSSCWPQDDEKSAWFYPYCQCRNHFQDLWMDQLSALKWAAVLPILLLLLLPAALRRLISPRQTKFQPLLRDSCRGHDYHRRSRESSHTTKRTLSSSSSSSSSW